MSTSKRLGGGGGGRFWWREGSSGSRRPLASEGTGGRKQVVGMSGGKRTKAAGTECSVRKVTAIRKHTGGETLQRRASAC